MTDTEKIISSYRLLLAMERRRTAELRARLRRHDLITFVAVCVAAVVSSVVTRWLT